MASNNEIVSGFDDEECGTLLITLEAGNGEKLCAHLKGTVDTVNCNVFARKMKKAIEAGYCNIVLDCTALSYLSSAGVGAFAALLKQCKEKGGCLALANVSDETKQLLKLLDFEQFFDFVDGSIHPDGLLTGRGVHTSEITAPKSPAAASAAVFPLVIKCPACGKALKVPKAGRYRCSACKAVISVTETGEVKLG